MASKDTLNNWSGITEKNINKCILLVNNYDVKQLQLNDAVEEFLVKVSSNYNCNFMVLLFTVLSSIGHFSECINVYNMGTKQLKPISVYEVLIAPSGVEKSKYINIISNACTTIEQYIYENYYKKQKVFTPVGANINDQELQQKTKVFLKDFDSWVNHFGSVKQVYTTPSLLHMMANTNIFFLANEGDAILQESSFYNPSDVSADIRQGTLIDCWDGNKIVKSTISHGTHEIKNRTVSMCIASTGRRWPDLLRELSKVQIAGGLHERCNYLCFDVNSTSHPAQLSPLAEQNFYERLYDDLISSQSTSQNTNYTLPQIFFIIKLFGYRTFIWSKESFTFIQPRLDELKRNKPCTFISNTIIFHTKQQMALRRRSAEHVVRYSCLLQMFFNAIKVLEMMDQAIVAHCGGLIIEEFELEAKQKIENFFGTPPPRNQAFHENSVPKEPLQISIDATKCAVALVFEVLLPQAVFLFDYEDVNENMMVGSLVSNSSIKPITKQEKIIIQIEKHVMNLNYTFFHKSCITDHHFRDKRSLVDRVLNNLANRQLLYRAPNDKPFFNTGRASSVQTYLKYLPDTHDEQRFRCELLNLYDIQFEEYKASFEDVPLLPINCKLTTHGIDFLRQEPYHLIINKIDNDLSGGPDVDTNIAAKKPSNYEISSDNNKVEYAHPAANLNDINEHFPMENLVYINGTKTTTNNNNSMNMEVEERHADQPLQNLLFSTIVDKTQSTVDNTSNNKPTEKNFANHDELVISQHDTIEEAAANPIIDINDNSSSLLSSINEDVVRPTEKRTSEEISNNVSNEEIHLSTKIIKNNKAENCADAESKDVLKKILLIQSLLLTKSLIKDRIKISANAMQTALNYLIENKFLIFGKFLESGRRKVDGYLKFVPENIEGPTDKYILQGRLMNFEINVDDYIESLKKLEFISASSRPAAFFVNILQQPPYLQLNISLSMKTTDPITGKGDYEDEESRKNENFGEVQRKKRKPNNENE